MKTAITPHHCAMQHAIALVAAFNKNGEILLLKRPEDAHCGGLWSFPGGKVGDGEMPLQAAKRELREETGLSGEKWCFLGSHTHPYPDRTLQFTLFSCFCPNISPLVCAEGHCWADSRRMSDYSMPEANTALLAILESSGGDA